MHSSDKASWSIFTESAVEVGPPTEETGNAGHEASFEFTLYFDLAAVFLIRCSNRSSLRSVLPIPSNPLRRLHQTPQQLRNRRP